MRQLRESWPRLNPGDLVRTPSGRVAVVLEVAGRTGEVLVQWLDGDRAHFKAKILKLLQQP